MCLDLLRLYKIVLIGLELVNTVSALLAERNSRSFVATEHYFILAAIQSIHSSCALPSLKKGEWALFSPFIGPVTAISEL